MREILDPDWQKRADSDPGKKYLNLKFIQRKVANIMLQLTNNLVTRTI